MEEVMKLWPVLPVWECNPAFRRLLCGIAVVLSVLQLGWQAERYSVVYRVGGQFDGYVPYQGASAKGKGAGTTVDAAAAFLSLPMFHPLKFLDGGNARLFTPKAGELLAVARGVAGPIAAEAQNPAVPDASEAGNPIMPSVPEITDVGNPIVPGTADVGNPIVPGTTDVGNPIVSETTDVENPIVPDTTDVGNPIISEATDAGNPSAPETVEPAVPDGGTSEAGSPAGTGISGFCLNPSGYIVGVTGGMEMAADGLLCLPADGACTGIEAGALDFIQEEVYEIYIPANITYIAPGAFNCLPGLLFIQAEPGNPAYYSDGGVLYECGGAEAAFPAGRGEW